jgi:aspartate 1-decarboxylase
MFIQLLRVKIQQLIVSESSEHYPGSIAIPPELIEAAGLRMFEQVHVNNLTNGNRILTYVVPSKKRGYVTLNGAASKLFKKGDKIHVLSYCYCNEDEAADHEPKILRTDENNFLVKAEVYRFEHSQEPVL